MTNLLQKAELHRAANASITTFVWVGRQHGYKEELLMEVADDLLEDIGYRAIELMETKDFVEFWTGFTIAYNSDPDNQPDALDLEEFNTKLVAFK